MPSKFLYGPYPAHLDHLNVPRVTREQSMLAKYALIAGAGFVIWKMVK